MTDVHIDAGVGATATTNRTNSHIFKSHGWRWSRNLNSWYLPRTLRPSTLRHKVDSTVTACEQAGLTVAVEWDDSETETWVADAPVRAKNKAELRRVRAEQLRTDAGRIDDTNSAVRAIMNGTPILAGHHSEARHTRDVERMGRSDQRALEARLEAARLEDLARERPVDPGAVVRRRERLQKEQRRYAGDAAELRRIEAQLAELPTVDPFDELRTLVRVGDVVHTTWGLKLVRKINKKTVVIDSGHGPWTHNLAWDKVSRLVRDGETLWVARGDS